MDEQVVETLQVILTSLGGTALGLAIAAFLSKSILVHYFTRQVESYKASLNHENEITIAKIKAELAKAEKTDERTHEYSQVMRRYHGPLQHAAYDLQSRLYAIVTQNLIPAYVDHGEQHEREYVIYNSAFVIAQYFAWAEIIRNEIQFIDFTTSDETRRFSCLQNELYGLWRTDVLKDEFRLWSGEQRAIGELMIESQGENQTCIGYARFVDMIKNNEQPLLNKLVKDVASFSQKPEPSFQRLTRIQHILIELLYFLDPDYTRFPEERRSLISASLGDDKEYQEDFITSVPACREPA